MPQIEQMGTYLSQAFWLVVTFAVLFLILWKIALPRVTAIRVERQERADEDLRRAEQLKSEADRVLAEYEKTMNEARTAAQAHLREASEKLAAENARRQEALDEELRARTQQATDRIEAARTEALASVRTIAADVAQAATARLLDTEVPATEAEAVVATAMQERS